MTTKRAAFVAGVVTLTVGFTFFLRFSYSKLWPLLFIAVGGGMLAYGASEFK